MLDLMPIHQAIDTQVSVYHPSNDPVRSLRIPALLCPSATMIRENTTCYAGVHSSKENPITATDDGVFLLNRFLSSDDISDGLGYTLFLGEKLSRFNQDLGWTSGTRSSLRNAGHSINADYQALRGPTDPKATGSPTYVGGFLSDHPGGAHLLLGSGETRFASESTDTQVLAQMASRADGELPLTLQTQESSDSKTDGADGEN